MSNPLESHLDALRRAQPRPEAIEHAVSRLGKSHPPRLVPLAVGVAAVSLFALWPRGSSGAAWAQISAQRMPDRYVLKTYRQEEGKPILCDLVVQDRPAHCVRNWYRLPNGTLDFRYGPHLSYRESADHSTITPVSPRSDIARGWMPHDTSRLDLATLLSDDHIRQIAVDRRLASRLGVVDRYRLEQPLNDYDPLRKKVVPGKARLDVYVETSGRRVLGWDSYLTDGRLWSFSTVTYPQKIDSHEFDPPRQARQPVYRMERALPTIAAGIAKGLGTVRKGGSATVLRAVVQDHRKALWIVWSGTPPNGDLAQRASVLNVPNGHSFGLASLTSKGVGGYHAPFGGHAVQLRSRVDYVDLAVPVFKPGSSGSIWVGSGRLRHIPVVAIDSIYSLADELKLTSGTGAVRTP